MKECPFKPKIIEETKYTFEISKQTGQTVVSRTEFGRCTLENCAMYKNGECKMKA